MSLKHRAMRSGGFTIIEIMIAMTLLSVVLIPLAGLTFDVSRRSLNSSSDLHRTATVATHVGRLGVVSFDSLASKAGCTTQSANPFPHQRCISVSTLSTSRLQVTLIVTPTNTAHRPDTVVFERTRPSGGNPLNR